MKTRNQIQLYLWPMLAKSFHRRHQPIETRMTFHGDAQLSGLTLRDPGEIALSILHAARYLVGKFDETLTRRGQTQFKQWFTRRFALVGEAAGFAYGEAFRRIFV